MLPSFGDRRQPELLGASTECQPSAPKLARNDQPKLRLLAPVGGSAVHTPPVVGESPLHSRGMNLPRLPISPFRVGEPPIRHALFATGQHLPMSKGTRCARLMKHGGLPPIPTKARDGKVEAYPSVRGVRREFRPRLVHASERRAMTLTSATRHSREPATRRRRMNGCDTCSPAPSDCASRAGCPTSDRRTSGSSAHPTQLDQPRSRAALPRTQSRRAFQPS